MDRTGGEMRQDDWAHQGTREEVRLNKRIERGLQMLLKLSESSGTKYS